MNIQFTLPQESTVTVEILDALQRVVATPLLQQQMSPGTHSMSHYCRAYTNGTYTVRVRALEADGRIITTSRQIVLLR